VGSGQQKETWQAIAPRLFDDHLDRVLKVAVEVLTERDPQFELPKSERYAAAIHGKTMKHSSAMREGLSETLALLGSQSGALTSASHGKAEGTARVAVRKILEDADWVLWASLNDCLPALAEAAPREFLDAVENTLSQTPSPFVEVFGQESSGFVGRNYTTGLLWGLEALAWHPDYLTRVTVILGDLAALDPGGNWANRPANSLSDIFLPWHPQTCADIPKRKAAISALLREQPEVCWKLLLALLPGNSGVTSGTHKPVWRDAILAGWSETVLKKDYWEQVVAYADLTVDLATKDLPRLKILIERLPDLPPKIFSRLLDHLTTEAIQSLPEAEKRPIWEALIDLTTNHRKFSEAEWAMPKEIVERIDAVATRLAPKEPALVARRLFTSRDWDLHDETGSYEEQQKKLSEARQAAVLEVLKATKLAGVVSLAKEVESARQLGIALGHIKEDAADTTLLPTFLMHDEKALKDLAGGFVIGRLLSQGLNWVDKILGQPWDPPAKLELLLLLPFEEHTWTRVEKYLGAQQQNEYWSRANVWGSAEKEKLLNVIPKLLENARPLAALNCLDRLIYHKIQFPPELAVQTLLDLLKSKEAVGGHDRYEVQDLIKWLQTHPPKDEKAILTVEWNYLPVLGRHSQARPKTLERRLAEDPAFICEVIRAVFRSDKIKKEEWKPTEEDKALAKNAYELLQDWALVPGATVKGGFDPDAFRRWLKEVTRISESTGHLAITMHMVGQVLPHTPADPDGLWIHTAVAEALNAKEADEMRDGYTNKLFNMRGVHGFTSGKEELEIAAGYHKKAEALDAKGFQRIAASIRELAKSYEREAEREAKRDPLKD
jgi:hypothetical protein